MGFFTISCSISVKMRAWPSLGVTHPLLFSLNLWHRWMTLLLRRCAGMDLEVGMWIGLHIRKFANMKIQVPHFRGGFGITPNEGSTISAFYSVRWSSGWVATGATDLPKTSRTRGRPGWILLLPTPGMHLFSRLFSHRMLFSFRIVGVLNGPLCPIECPRL